MSTRPEPCIFRKVSFGPFEYDERSGELRKHGSRIRLHGQPLQILTILLSKAGQVTTREEFHQALWQGSTFVDFENGLNAAVYRLRQVLGESSGRPCYIETVPGRGYRFIAPVEFSAPDMILPEGRPDVGSMATTVPPPNSLPARPKTFTAILGVLTFGALGLVVGGLWLAHSVKQNIELDRLETQGNFFVSRWSEADIRKGIEYYNRAIVLSPASASAYDGIATGWSFLSDLYVPPHEAMPKSKAAALEAVRLDNRLASGHVTLGVVKMQYDWDWAGAEKEFRRAIELRPSDGAGHRLYGWLLIALGRFKEAQAEMRRPLEAEPVNDFNLMELGLSYYFARQYEPALEQCRRAIGIDPTSYWSHMLLGWAYEQEGKFPSALDAFTKANRLNDSSQVIASLGHAYAVAGQRAEAEKVIADLQKKSEHSYVSPYDVATIYAGLGDREQTLVWLGKAYEDRSGWLALWLNVDPKFDALRSDPRFQTLLRGIGFAP